LTPDELRAALARARTREHILTETMLKEREKHHATVRALEESMATQMQDRGREVAEALAKLERVRADLAHTLPDPDLLLRAQCAEMAAERAEAKLGRVRAILDRTGYHATGYDYQTAAEDALEVLDG